MTNDDLSAIESALSRGLDLGNASAKLLLEQLRDNAAETVRKRLADAERELNARKELDLKR